MKIKRLLAKKAGCPELWTVGEGHSLELYIHKPAGEDGCGATSTSVLGEGKGSKSGYSVARSNREWRKGTSPSEF
jgi:hypothetical protein